MSQYGATKKAAESVPVKAQLHSPDKLTTLRRENRKIRHEIEILKANEHAPHVYKLQINQVTPKKHTTKSRETIPLSFTIKNFENSSLCSIRIDTVISALFSSVLRLNVKTSVC
jgi:hypothetical protein